MIPVFWHALFILYRGEVMDTLTIVYRTNGHTKNKPKPQQVIIAVPAHTATPRLFMHIIIEKLAF